MPLSGTHVGDRIVAECLTMSVASQSVANTKGLHVSISGNSGKGKTHACNTMPRLLHKEYRIKGTVSNKALFYHDDLRPGTVLLFDDISMFDDLQELMKSATANFQEPIEHRMLTVWIDDSAEQDRAAFPRQAKMRMSEYVR